jgi:multicomponent K+:H+ antiporter subunit D
VNHLPVLPILLPLLAGCVLLLSAQAPAVLRRGFALVSTLLLLLLGAGLLRAVAGGDYLVYALGDWPAPFGIVLVVDRLAAALLLLTAIVAVASLAYAIVRGSDAAGPHFLALFQFQLLGINGALLTGDLFNLFVFFEILLIASYTLLLHGMGTARVGAAIHVVALNLVGSALFLFAVGLIYAATGTLNLADLARAMPAVAAADVPLVRAGALLLLVVFALKAALLPLSFWLPPAYSASSAAVAALFAMLTKVGVYAILRFYPLVFGAEAAALADLARPWVLPLALATMLFGALGVLAARELRVAVGWLVVSSVGTLLVAVGLFSEQGYAAAVYYLPHSTLVAAAAFLVADLVIAQRGESGGRLEPVVPLRDAGLLGALAGAVAIAAAGLPPLSGFFGKLMVLEAAHPHAAAPWIWTAVLVASLLIVVALARIGSALFWRPGESPGTAGRADPRAVLATGVPLAALVLLVAAGGPATRFAQTTAAQLAAPGGYVEAVLGPQAAAGTARRTLR